MTHPAATPPTAEQVEQIEQMQRTLFNISSRPDSEDHAIKIGYLRQILLAALAPAERASPSAWLVEMQSVSGAPVYAFMCERNRIFRWIADHAKAMRFTRQIDAANAMCVMQTYQPELFEDGGWERTRSVEHMWMSAERAEAVQDGLEEAVRLCEVGEYLYSAKTYSYGDGQTEPREYGIDWQWQQSKPGEYGQGVLLAEAVKWHEEQAADGTLTEAGKLRAYIASLPAATRAGALDAARAETHTVDYLRLRFFRDLTDGQRLTIFDRAGLGKEAEEAGSTHAWQRLLFNRMIREGQERLIVEALKAASAAGDGRSEK